MQHAERHSGGCSSKMLFSSRIAKGARSTSKPLLLRQGNPESYLAPTSATTWPNDPMPKPFLDTLGPSSRTIQEPPRHPELRDGCKPDLRSPVASPPAELMLPSLRHQGEAPSIRGASTTTTTTYLPRCTSMIVRWITPQQAGAAPAVAAQPPPVAFQQPVQYAPPSRIEEDPLQSQPTSSWTITLPSTICRQSPTTRLTNWSLNRIHHEENGALRGIRKTLSRCKRAVKPCVPTLT